MSYDAILLVSFGGPEGRDDVLPFLENVTRGRNIPRERLLEVAEHYYHFDGVSPINQQCRDLISALRLELDRHGIALPIYWGNRNWDPLLPDTLQDMKAAGVRRALAFVTASYSSWSSCRQYRENIADAQALSVKVLRKLIKFECSTTTPTSSPRMLTWSSEVSVRFRKIDARKRISPSQPTAFRTRCRIRATMFVS